MSASFTIPKSVVQNIARAKSLLKRDETTRALEALQTGLEQYDGSKLMGKARFEAEVLIEECVSELNRQPAIRSLLESLTKSKKVGVAYTPGQEQKLLALLPILHKALREAQASKRRSAEEERESRKKMLRDKGVALIKDKDMPKAKASLRRLAEEFGEDPDVLVDVGQLMLDAGMHYEAAEFFEQSMEVFPKDSRAYAGATQSYMVLREFEKAEAVYLNAIKSFGKHTKTMTNIANLYLAWNKKEKAFEAASEAYKLDASNAEAKAIIDKLS